MIKKRHNITPASYLILIKNNQTLLLRRFNTGFEDGNYTLIAGHLDEKETFLDAIVREAKEEANIDIEQNNLKVIHVINRYVPSNPSSIRERVDVFITASKWSGKIKNMEPEKCDDLRWFPLDNLPENTIPFIKQVFNCMQNKIFYSEYGFEEKDHTI